MIDFIHRWITQGWVIVTLAVVLAGVMILVSRGESIPVITQAIQPCT
jgi:hypothetical protein